MTTNTFISSAVLCLALGCAESPDPIEPLPSPGPEVLEPEPAPDLENPPDIGPGQIEEPESSQACMDSDFNGDGTVDETDLAILDGQISQLYLCFGTDAAVSDGCSEHDLDGSGLVDGSDQSAANDHYVLFLDCFGSVVISAPECFPADRDFDGVVAGTDFGFIAAEYSGVERCMNTPVGCSSVDLDEDGYVLGTDFAILAASVSTFNECTGQ